MRDRVMFWLKALAWIAATVFCGALALKSSLSIFPPMEYPLAGWLHIAVLAFVYGVVWYVLVAAALPGGWAERGIWRLTLFEFGIILMSRDRHEKKIESIQKAGYTVWPLGKRWVVAPSIPSWCMRLARRWRES